MSDHAAKAKEWLEFEQADSVANIPKYANRLESLTALLERVEADTLERAAAHFRKLQDRRFGDGPILWDPNAVANVLENLDERIAAASRGKGK